MLKEMLKDDKYYKKLGTKQLQSLARNLKIEFKDIKYCFKYRRKLRKRILENLQTALDKR